MANNSGAQSVMHVSWSITSFCEENLINFVYNGQISLVPTCPLQTMFSVFNPTKLRQYFTNLIDLPAIYVMLRKTSAFGIDTGKM